MVVLFQLDRDMPGMGILENVPVHFKTTNPRGKFTAKYTNTGSTDKYKESGAGWKQFS